MRTFGPARTLSFETLLDLVGDDPEPFPDQARDYVMNRRQQQMVRAKEIYDSSFDDEEAIFDATSEFVSCFGEFQQSGLFRPLQNEWERGDWSDLSFAALLRALHQSGCTTSLFLDVCDRQEFARIIDLLPPGAMQTSAELSRFEQVEEPIVVFRGGWAESPERLSSRGVSWSLSQDTADAFVVHNMAHRSNRDQPFLLRATICRSDILAMFEHEEEILVRPGAIKEFESIVTEKVRRRRNRRMTST